ncbi:hypothetical protein Fmac_010524 [Flemingia macrophylla]|uniref:Uncharacterized protein n=1 Tax=Flemingia macrophylla TaxID=520843 RepID=A0ABD1MKN4_9FABA
MSYNYAAANFKRSEYSDKYGGHISIYRERKRNGEVLKNKTFLIHSLPHTQPR